jgi:hypothetical protein
MGEEIKKHGISIIKKSSRFDTGRIYIFFPQKFPGKWNGKLSSN